MPEFKYTAKTSEGTMVSDKLTVADEESLRQRLKTQGLTLISLESEKKSNPLTKINDFLKKIQRISLTDKLFFTQHLGVMLKTGFAISRALNTLALQTKNNRFKIIISEIQKDVEGGVAFSKSLEKYPKVFSELYVSMIAAGEVSGKLDEVLKYLAIQLKKDHTLLAKIKSALTYPLIVLIAMVSIGIAMIIFVIPKITSIYTDANVELPLPTKILIATTDFIVHNGVVVAIGTIIFIVLFLRLLRTKRGKYIFHKVILKTPIAGPIIKKIHLARFTRTLSSLLKTDIPIVKTFKIISRILGNTLYKNFIMGASEELKKGKAIVKILEKDPSLFPPVVSQMIAIGEESGTLDSVSEEIAVFYEEDVDQIMNNLSVIIEPVLMIILGGAIGGMAAAVIMPMYSLVNAI